MIFLKMKKGTHIVCYEKLLVLVKINNLSNKIFVKMFMLLQTYKVLGFFLYVQG